MPVPPDGRRTVHTRPRDCTVAGCTAIRQPGVADDHTHADRGRGPGSRCSASRRLRLFDCRFDLARPDSGRQRYLDEHLPGAMYADLNRDLSRPATPTSGRHPLPAPDGIRGAAARLGRERRLAGGRLRRRQRHVRRAPVVDAALARPRRRRGARRRHASLDRSSACRPATRCRRRRTATSSRGRDPALAVTRRRGAARRGATRPRGSSMRGRRSATAARSSRSTRSQGTCPGARNHPFTLSLDDQGRFLPPGQLRAALRDAPRRRRPERTIAYCGSGVTACHLLLALEHAGLAGARLYPGSWSEWSSDPARPVATGPAP